MKAIVIVSGIISAIAFGMFIYLISQRVSQPDRAETHASAPVLTHHTAVSGQGEQPTQPLLPEYVLDPQSPATLNMPADVADATIAHPEPVSQARASRIQLGDAGTQDISQTACPAQWMGRYFHDAYLLTPTQTVCDYRGEVTDTQCSAEGAIFAGRWCQTFRNNDTLRLSIARVRG